MMHDLDVSAVVQATSAAAGVRGDDIFFGKCGNDRPHLISGWSGDEPGFRWMTEGTSAFAIDAPEGDFALELDCTPVFPPTPPKFPAQRLLVEVDGRPVAQTTVPGRRVLAFPIERASGNRRIVVTLHHPDAIHPAQLAHPTEDRTLGIRLTRARTLTPPTKASRTAASMRSIPRHGDARAHVEALTGLRVADLLNQFESLGHDCEFGLLQRRYGAEQISLLRFGDITPENLVLGLDAGFGEASDPRYVRAVAYKDADFRIHQEKYSFRYHTYMYPAEHTADEVAARHVKLLDRFRRITMERIADAEKMFVYKRVAPIGDAEAMALHLALRRHGRNTLLYVVPADVDHPSGYVTTTAYEGLLKGYVDHFWLHGDKDFVDRHWLELCVNAHIVAETVRGEAAPPA